MSFGRSHASIVLMVLAILVGGPNVLGQSSSLPAPASNGSVGVIVPVTGVADLGSFFTGALLIQSFAAQGTSIVASGVVTGALTGNGTFRNLVIQVTLPLDVTASRAGLNTDGALASQSSCDVLHLELAGTSVNVLGSTVALNPVAFDIASPTPQSSSAFPPVAQPAPAPTAGALTGTITRSPSANTTQVPGNPQAQPSTPAPNTPTVNTPTVNAPTVNAPTVNAPTVNAPTVNTPTANTPTTTPSQTPLASRLCAVNGFRDISNPTQLAQQLNGILGVLSGKQGS